MFGKAHASSLLWMAWWLFQSTRIDRKALIHTIHQCGLQLSDRDGSRSIHIYVRKPLPKLWISPSRRTMMLIRAMSRPSIALRGRSMVRLVPRLIVVHVRTWNLERRLILDYCGNVIFGGCATPKAGYKSNCNSSVL